MSKLKQVTVPDLGSPNQVDVIEIMVSLGEKVTEEAPLITLEGEKATMEVPSPFEGTVKSIAVKEGDKVATGHLILELESEDGDVAVVEEPEISSVKSKQDNTAANLDMRVPDLGGANTVDVIELLVKPGDIINKDDSVAVLESDKATMEVPASLSGEVVSLSVKVGDKVSANDVLLIVKGEAVAETAQEEKPVPTEETIQKTAPVSESKQATPVASSADVYAGPGVRRLARVLNIDLNQVSGSGKKGRVTREDLESYIQNRMQGSASAVQPLPDIDFSQFGDVEVSELSKIKRLTGEATHRSWSMIPHVTQFDEVDITELEAFRKNNKSMAEAKGAKLTMIVFVMKAIVSALKAFPTFNASLKNNGKELVLKKYFNIGVAVDTPNGLVVPVIRDVDQKGLIDLAVELTQISAKAREKGLSLSEMQGSCFTISSLGGIGGTAFTPIVNQPDVAILGLSKAKMQPVYDGETFIPRLIMPLSLSYDHRVIDGAEAARFTQHLAAALADIRRILM